MSEVVLEMKNVTKRFPGVIALKEVSIAVEKGEVMAIAAKTAPGKSTLMKVSPAAIHIRNTRAKFGLTGSAKNFPAFQTLKDAGLKWSIRN